MEINLEKDMIMQERTDIFNTIKIASAMIGDSKEEEKGD
jgi:hypothetical protein